MYLLSYVCIYLQCHCKCLPFRNCHPGIPWHSEGLTFFRHAQFVQFHRCWGKVWLSPFETLDRNGGSGEPVGGVVPLLDDWTWVNSNYDLTCIPTVISTLICTLYTMHTGCALSHWSSWVFLVDGRMWKAQIEFSTAPWRFETKNTSAENSAYMQPGTLETCTSYIISYFQIHWNSNFRFQWTACATTSTAPAAPYGPQRTRSTNTQVLGNKYPVATTHQTCALKQR